MGYGNSHALIHGTGRVHVGYEAGQDSSFPSWEIGSKVVVKMPDVETLSRMPIEAIVLGVIVKK